MKRYLLLQTCTYRYTDNLGSICHRTLYGKSAWRIPHILLAGLVLASCSTQQEIPPGESEIRMPPHHTQNGFRNPYPVDDLERSFFSYWNMRLFKEDFPDHAETAHLMPRMELDSELLANPGPLPRVTWIGHATFLVQYRGTNILTDPHFSDRASPLSFTGPQRLVPLPIRIEQLPPIDYVVISHNHYDQLDEESVKALGTAPKWLVPLKLKATLVDWGIDTARVVELDWWEQFSEAGLQIAATPAHHWSARGLYDRNETLWSSWMVTMNGFRFWFAGDTAYNPIHFKEIGTRFPAIDMALIPIGAYAPRWFMKNSHVTPEEAVIIHREIASRRSFGMHWGTFQLTSEPMLEPPERLALAMDEVSADVAPFETMAIGETIQLSLP